VRPQSPQTSTGPRRRGDLRFLVPVLLVLTGAAACGDAARGGDGTISRATIAANGFVFDARVAGPERGPLVLLLHGFPQSSLSWEAQLAALGASGYRAVAPDLRGYSPGARPTEVGAYRLDVLTSDVFALADALGAERFHVVGHDWGATIAWNAAMADPARILSLTAVSVPHPVPFAIAFATDPDQQERSRYIAFFRQEGVAEQVLLANDAAVLRSIYGDGPASLNADEYVRLLSEPGALTAALSYYRALGLEGAGGERVVVPTLYIWSTEDAALGRAAAEATGDWVDAPYTFLVLDGVSHWVPEEAPDALATALLAHLAAHGRD